MSDLISKRELYHKLAEAYNKGYLTWGANEVIKDIIGECDSVENKGDLISRQAVFDELEKWDWQDLYLPIHFKQILDDVPSVENRGEWIPVSERLPLLRGLYKISDDVLITNGFEIDMGYFVERKGKIFWHYYGSEYEVGIKDEDNDATAWMPLPEPYKAESEDT